MRFRGAGTGVWRLSALCWAGAQVAECAGDDGAGGSAWRAGSWHGGQHVGRVPVVKLTSEAVNLTAVKFTVASDAVNFTA
jgi:hypothetical protein